MKKEGHRKKESLSPLEIVVLWGHSAQDVSAADEGRDEPCCALVAHLLLSGPHLGLLGHTTHCLAQNSRSCTRSKSKPKQDSITNTGRGNESENTNERKSVVSLP